MTFDPSVPLNSDSPSIFPAQNQTNMNRLQTIIEADHQFNLSADTNDGWHKLVHLIPQAPSGALAATGRLYVKSSGGNVNLFYMDDAATPNEYQLTPGMPIRAAVNFNGIGGAVIRSQYNVSSVVRDNPGRYTINFTNPMPDTNYIVQITGMRDSSGDVSNGSIAGSATYGSSVQTGLLKIAFYGQSDSFRDVLMGNVTIFSVT